MKASIINATGAVLEAQSESEPAGAQTLIKNAAAMGYTTAQISINTNLSQDEFDRMVAVPTAPVGTGSGIYGVKNYVINGAMQISQENGQTAIAVSAGGYPVDMFNCNGNFTGGAASAFNALAVTPAGSPGRIRININTSQVSLGAANYVGIMHALEGLITADLMFGTPDALTVTIQFGVRGPSGTYSVALTNGAQNRSFIREFTIGPGEAGQDVYKSVTIPGDVTGTWPTDTTRAMMLWVFIASGSNYQAAAGSWGAGNKLSTVNCSNFMSNSAGTTFDLFDVGMYVGTAAPAFQVPDYITELARCQRYWESGLQCIKYNNLPAGITAAYDTQRFLVQKRVSPTITMTGYQYYSSGSNTAFTPTLNTITVEHFEFLGTSLTNWNGWYNTGVWKANARP